LSRYDISGSDQAARNTNVLSVRECLVHRCPTETCLAGASGIHRDQLPTSVFSFVGEFCEEARPTGIVNRLGQHSSSEALDVQVFHNDCAEVLYQPKRQPVLELVPLISDSSVNLLQKSNNLATTLRAAFTSSNPSLCPPKFRFGLPVPTRVRNCIAVGQSREGFQANVDPDCMIAGRKWFCFTFDGEADVPLATLTLHGDRLDYPSNRTMQLDFDFPDTLNSERVAGEFDAIAVTGKSEAVETATRFESRIARRLVPLHSKEERLERLVYPTKNVLAARKICKTEIASGSNLFQLVGLRVVVDRDSLLPSVPTLLKSGVVKTAGFPQLLVESIRLETSCE
jgi:hypothetical protein